MVLCSTNIDPRALIREELAKGAKQIVIPPGTYRLDQKGASFVTLKGVKDVQIDCSGVTFIGLSTTTMLELIDCRNVRIKGLVIDYDPLPFTQGVIRSVSPDKTWEVEIIEGYPTENIRENAGVDMRIQVYDPMTDELVNPLRYGQDARIAKAGQKIFRVSGGGDRAGRPGDIAVFNVLSVKQGMPWKQGAVLTSGCEGVVFEDVSVRSSAFMGFVSQGDTSSAYVRCVLDRCPPEKDYMQRGMKRLRSLNVDGFHIKNNVVGPRIEECVARYMGDDCVNISGMYSLVSSSSGKEIRVISSFYKEPDIHPGETLEIMAFDGRRLPDAKVESIRQEGGITPDEGDAIAKLPLVSFYLDPKSKHLKYAYRVTLDREVDLEFGDVVISGDRVGNGFAIKNNTFGPIRSRPILIKASRGVVSGNTIVGAGFDASIKVGPEYYWMEGSIGSDIQITGNTIRNSQVPAVWIGGMAGKRDNLLPADSRSEIRILDNVIQDIPTPAIIVHGCTDLAVEGNSLSLRAAEDSEAIELRNVKKVSESDNQTLYLDLP